MKVRESHTRVLVKSLTYTGIVMVSDAIIIFLITGETNETIAVLIITNIASLIIYYIHAHVSNRFKRGHRIIK